ncbi:hypothetical protein [Streptomyces sp. 058-1L]
MDIDTHGLQDHNRVLKADVTGALTVRAGYPTLSTARTIRS